MRVLANNLTELKEADIPALYKKIKDYCDGFNETEDDPEYHLGNNFNIDLGGPIMMIESEKDLFEIKTTKTDENGKYLSIAEVADTFDICEYFDRGDYVYVLLCTHNGGGITYIIPSTIAYLRPTVEQSVFLTNVDYTDPEDDEDAYY